MTFKCLNGIAPSYLSDVVTRYVPRRNLRSADGHRLFDVKYNLPNYGFRSFSVTTVVEWHASNNNILWQSDRFQEKTEDLPL